MSFDFGTRTKIDERLAGVFNVVAVDKLNRATILQIVNADGNMDIGGVLNGPEGLLQQATNCTGAAKASVDEKYIKTGYIHLDYKRSIYSGETTREPELSTQ